MTKTVGQLLDAKGSETWSIGPGATVYEALRLLADKNVGALVIVEDDRVCGIMSERDYTRKIMLLERDSRNTAVSDIMTAEVRTVTREATVSECMELITEHHIRHLPVVEDDRLIGLISVGDVVKAVMAEQAFLIQQLERYITG
ncbi:MAG: CBS domain-containing protein [bacterium]|nr:CBS domain-containing protein [bacterium]MCP4966660.1 CBS domain-containing protein [bacterium]